MEQELKGIVVFFEPDYTTKTIKETSRSPILPYETALNLYANTANPASQLYSFTTEDEREAADALLRSNIANREWLDDLFEQI